MNGFWAVLEVTGMSEVRFLGFWVFWGFCGSGAWRVVLGWIWGCLGTRGGPVGRSAYSTIGGWAGWLGALEAGPAVCL